MRAFILAALVAVLAMPAVAVAAPRPAANCENVSTIIAGWSIPDVDDDGNFVGNDVFADWLGGDLEGRNTVTKITPGGTIHFTGALNFTDTDYGSFQATSNGVVAPNGKLNITVDVDGGSGFFVTNGAFDLGSGEWLVHWHGRICLD